MAAQHGSLTLVTVRALPDAYLVYPLCIVHDVNTKPPMHRSNAPTCVVIENNFLVVDWMLAQ